MILSFGPGEPERGKLINTFVSCCLTVPEIRVCLKLIVVIRKRVRTVEMLLPCFFHFGAFDHIRKKLRVQKRSMRAFVARPIIKCIQRSWQKAVGGVDIGYAAVPPHEGNLVERWGATRIVLKK